MSGHPKKHHFVPQFLLRRFADSAGRLVVHKVLEQRQYQSTVTNLAHRNFGHTLYWPGREPDHVTLEAAMAEIEGDAATAVRELAERRSRTVPGDVQVALAWFLALQWHRSRFLMYLIAQETDANSRGFSAQQIQTSLLGQVSAHVINPWSLRNDSVRPKDRWNFLVSILLGTDMHWSCYRPQGGGLIVSDNIVCFSGPAVPPPAGVPRGFFDHGIGAGLDGFQRVTVPLGNDLALIITRDSGEARRLNTAVLNRFTIFNSREFVAHAPGWTGAHPKLAEDLPTWFEIQRMVAPAFMQNYGTHGVM
ncbi:DUF4238 domain-containing protein [Streptomyces graminilatus]|uniref:DUF4238 domain-containing protein n=1 Tax=Streptomyces graminilatus TaxID=1464070 RepID=UPI000A91E088|nr:DUF4238 domain-containing protein [Streptomyces graminilatus]